LQSIVKGVDFVPQRVSRTETSAARRLLERDGAVILTGWPMEPDSVVNAATAVLGTRLRELEKVRPKTTTDAARRCGYQRTSTQIFTGYRGCAAWWSGPVAVA
jgi:hypothetical protein